MGRRDSNPRIPVPKTGALPLGHAPIFIRHFGLCGRHYSTKSSTSQELFKSFIKNLLTKEEIGIMGKIIEPSE